MTRLSIFSSPFLLGFDHFERTLDRATKCEGYPPYNVEQTGENTMRITLAVAGFSQDDLTAHIEDNQLVIRGRQPQVDQERVYLHRGIASRQFQRIFVLAEGIEVANASLDNGLLHVDLTRPVVQPKIQNVPITKGKAKAAQTITVKPEEV
jgi:HSP20 family molecular chaperone IbpA